MFLTLRAAESPSDQRKAPLKEKPMLICLQNMQGLLYAGSLLVILLLLLLYSPKSYAIPEQHVQVSVLQENSALVPNKTHWIMLRFQIDDEWHIYWKNPGDAGLPPQVSWKTQTPHLVIGALHFPLPERIPFEGLMVFGYKGLVRFLVPLEISESIERNAIDVQAQVSWLVCKEICIPESTTLRFFVRMNTQTHPLVDTIPEFVQAHSAIPRTVPNKTTFQHLHNTLTLALDTKTFSIGTASQVTFFPYARNIIHNTVTQPMRRERNHVFLDLTTTATQHVEHLQGLLVVETPSLLGIQRQGFVLNPKKSRISFSTSTPLSTEIHNDSFQITTEQEEHTEKTNLSMSLSLSSLSLLMAFLFGFLGGIVLNMMPCVFPVLFLKVYPLIQQRHHTDIWRHRKEGLAFTVGILVMFVFLGTLLLLLKAGGLLLGWGFHLQYPIVVFGLMTLFLVIGLTFSDVITVGKTWSQLGAALPLYKGYMGSFLHGLLLVVVASPCTAPFMGTAIGFAVTQSLERSVLIFVSLGLGMALPYVLLSWNTHWLRRLPQPGPWMVRVKHAFAFPMYGTALWLLWIWVHQVGIQSLWWGFVSIWILGLSAWFLKITRSQSTPLRRLGLVIMLLSWLMVLGVSARITSQQEDETLYREQPYSNATLQDFLQEQRTVFVYFTAAWCVTCLINETVLHSERLQQVFRQHQIVTLKADWTLYNPEITQALERFGRNSIPFYVLYRPGQEPFIFPELLSEEVLMTGLTKNTS